MEARWEHFSHGADIGLRATADDRAGLFVAIARAMTATITDLDTVDPVEEVDVQCEAPNDELLLVDWLNALIYQMATRRMLFGEFDVALDDHRLRGRARGEPVDRDRHEPAVEVKGATYTALEVSRLDGGGWRAQCVIDV